MCPRRHGRCSTPAPAAARRRIPLKLADPELHLRMVEVKTRKAVFLREAVRTLGSRDAEVETSRFEELLPRPELHESLDLVSIRAVRIEARTLLTLQAFLKTGGKILPLSRAWRRAISAGVRAATASLDRPLIRSVRSRSSSKLR